MLRYRRHISNKIKTLEYSALKRAKRTEIKLVSCQKENDRLRSLFKNKHEIAQARKNIVWNRTYSSQKESIGFLQ